ncbi:MAG: hypothetical protein ACWA5T_00800 [Parvularcula sp.]
MQIGEPVFLLALGVTGCAILIALRVWWAQRDHNPGVCDLRRCIVIVGDGQNDDDCIAQRVALKPHLMLVRDASINVVEVYGTAVPRRNGRPMEWTNNKKLRRSLDVENGFSLVCIDDDGEIAMRVRLPVSEHVIAELIAGSTQEALPSPEPEEAELPTEEVEPEPAKPDWSVGVLR